MSGDSLPELEAVRSGIHVLPAAPSQRRLVASRLTGQRTQGLHGPKDW